MNIVEYAKMRKMFGGGSGGDLDALIDGSLTEITSNVTKLRDYFFQNCKALTTVNFPNVTVVGTNVFEGCTALVSVNLPLLGNMTYGLFSGCKSLTNITLPRATTVSYNGFALCEKLVRAIFPLVKSVQGWAFNANYLLTKLDLPEAQSIANQAFRYCYSFTTLVLRCETMCTLAGVAAFENCYHFYGTVNSTYNPDGLKDGYIYVPRALIDSYKAATNWVTFADRFRALEDYTVDGTTTGELDESKVSL